MNLRDACRRLRFRQVRAFSKVFCRLAVLPGMKKVLGTMGKSDLCAKVLVGFNRTFPSFEDANQCALQHGFPSHEHPGNITNHLRLNENARLSDYPVLFHLQNLLGEVKSVLDIGGSAGNLFYCYSKYLQYDAGFTWTVFEVPENVQAGRHIAELKGEKRLRFTDQLHECTNADAVIISGALHYFDPLPPELMGDLGEKPRHVFINRTPVTDGQTAITIQDAGFYFAMSPARILSRKTLLEAMAGANYELKDEWTIPDLRFRIPLSPASSVSAYSGFYFRANEES